MVSSSLSLLSPPFSLPKNFVAVALPFADISRRLNVKEEPRGNCVCTWKSRRAFHLATHRDSGRFHFPATKSDVSLRVFGGGARSKASDKLPRINDESGCLAGWLLLMVIKNTPGSRTRKVKFLGLLLLRNFNLDLL